MSDDDGSDSVNKVRNLPDDRLLKAIYGKNVLLAPFSKTEGQHAQLAEQEMTRQLDMLTSEERMVLRLRLGLENGQTLSQRKVADQVGYSKSRVQRIERKALNKLRVTSPQRAD